MNRSLKMPLIGMLFSAVIAVFPLILVLLVDLIAKFNGCLVNEGSVQPCTLAGVDIGGFLHNLFMLGWYLFISFPVGALGFIGCFIWLVRWYIKRYS